MACQLDPHTQLLFGLPGLQPVASVVLGEKKGKEKSKTKNRGQILSSHSLKPLPITLGRKSKLFTRPNHFHNLVLDSLAPSSILVPTLHVLLLLDLPVVIHRLSFYTHLPKLPPAIRSPSSCLLPKSSLFEETTYQNLAFSSKPLSIPYFHSTRITENCHFLVC